MKEVLVESSNTWLESFGCFFFFFFIFFFLFFFFFFFYFFFLFLLLLFFFSYSFHFLLVIYSWTKTNNKQQYNLQNEKKHKNESVDSVRRENYIIKIAKITVMGNEGSAKFSTRASRLGGLINHDV